MRDINLPMRKAYVAALAGVSAPVYYQQADDSKTDPVYVVFDSVSNTDISTKNTNDVTCSVRVTVHSFSTKYNTGQAADLVAGQILQALYPSPVSTIQADGVQVLTTKLITDIVQPYNLNNTRNYVDRILIFQHKIFIT